MASYRLRWSLSLFAVLACGVAAVWVVACRPERAAKGQSARPARLGAAAPQHAPAMTPRVFALGTGPAVERQLAVGAADAYPIELAAGQYLVATFDQRGIDVAVDVFGPDHRLLFRVDGLYGTHGVESVHLVAETSGRYLIEVRSRDAEPGGRYLARIESLRPAAAVDYLRSAAERSLCEASVLIKTEPISWEAAAKLEAASRLFRELGVSGRQAEAMYRLGRLDLRANRYREALDLFHSALVLYRRLGDRQFVALSYSEIGRCEFKLIELQQAEADYLRALREWRTLPLQGGRANTLDCLAELFRDQGRAATALRFYRQEAELWHRLGDAAREADILIRISSNLRAVGDRDQALAQDRRARELCRKCSGPRRAAIVTETGDVYLDAGEPRRALPFFKRALALQPATDLETRVLPLAEIGRAYRQLQDYDHALQAYDESLRIYQALGDRQSEANVWIDLGAAHRYLRQLGASASCYDRALQLARAIGFRTAEAEALLGAGRIARDQGNPRNALLLGEAALAIVEELRADVSRPDQRSGFLARYVDFYEFLVEVLMQLHAAEPGGGFDRRALGYSEQLRARGLAESLAARRWARPASPALLAERQRLIREIGARDLELRQAVPPGGSPSAADPRLQALLERWREVEAQSGLAVSAAKAASSAPPRPLAEIQRDLLDDHTLLLEYCFGLTKTFLWAVTSDGIASFELRGREELEPLVRSTYALLSQRQQPEGEELAAMRAAELSRVLLGPVAERLGDRRLLIVADGVLQYIPFAALPDPRNGVEPLVLHHEIVYAPSLEVLAALRGKPSTRFDPRGPLAVIADPVFGGQDERARHLAIAPDSLDPLLASMPRLPYSRIEAEKIAALARPQVVLQALGFDANRELVTGGRLKRYRILHFATHGTLRADRPELSALALSQLDRAGRPRDGWLRVDEIAGLDLPAELVVLSACDTALGRELAGEGLVGLPQGFMSAGAQRVLVSLWDVGDRSTAELMGHFYRSLLVDGLPPSAALCASQRAMWRDAHWHSPSSWAGFVLIGDWR